MTARQSAPAERLGTRKWQRLEPESEERHRARYIAWFQVLRRKNLPRVGGKNPSLGELYGELTAAGVRVSNGFAVTGEAGCPPGRIGSECPHGLAGLNREIRDAYVALAQEAAAAEATQLSADLRTMPSTVAGNAARDTPPRVNSFRVRRSHSGGNEHGSSSGD